MATIFVFSILFASWTTALTTSAQAPNIIFLMTDSMDGRNMDPTHSQYSLMNMPNLRNIANKGTQFINTYTNSPICVAGRSCLFTGRRIDNNRAFNNGMGFGMMSDNKTIDKTCNKYYGATTCQYTFGSLQQLNYTLLDAMQDIGYEVYLYGKVDVGAGIYDLPSQSNVTATGFHTGPQLILTTRSANIAKTDMTNPNDLVNSTDNNVYPIDWNISSKCVDRINLLGSTSTTRSRPFLLYCSINIPHPPFDTNATWLNMVDIDSIPLPEWNSKNSFHPYDRYMSIIKNVWGNFSEQQIQTIRQNYYGMNVEADYILGLFINASYQNGFNLSNTIFVYTSDHGENNMEHRQYMKNSMYEGSVRIPLFFAGPGIGTNIISNPTQIIDILPTLISLGGGAVPEWLDGYSLTEYFNEYNINVSHKINKLHPDYITSQYHARNGPTGSFMVRKGDLKYIQFGHTLSTFKNYTALLFNLKDDPNELNNLDCHQPQYENTCNQMENILRDLYDYEYTDCIAKQTDFKIFEEYFWNKYNQTILYKKLQNVYHGFDQDDWQTILNWRSEMFASPSCDLS